MSKEQGNRVAGPASIIFINLPDMFSLDANRSFDAIQRLHWILEQLKVPEGVRKLSAFTGAILHVPAGAFNDQPADQPRSPHALMGEVFQQALADGLPLQVGISHGEPEWFGDVKDGTVIGECVNYAARIATSAANAGLLHHLDYLRSRKGVDRHELRPQAEAGEVMAKGKAHDGEGFPCRPAVEPPPVRKDWSQFTELGYEPVKQVSGLVVSVDLPRFSKGHHKLLSDRFRGFVDAAEKLIAEKKVKQLHYSPGGDGGVFVFPEADSGADIFAILDAFRVELEEHSLFRTEEAGVECCIGAAHGMVDLYRNAEDKLRPTGVTCAEAEGVSKGIKSGSIACTSEVGRIGGAYFTEKRGTRNPAPAAEMPTGAVVERFLMCGDLKETEPSRPENYEAYRDECADVFADVVARVAEAMQADEPLRGELVREGMVSEGNNHETMALDLVVHVSLAFNESVGRFAIIHRRRNSSEGIVRLLGQMLFMAMSPKYARQIRERDQHDIRVPDVCGELIGSIVLAWANRADECELHSERYPHPVMESGPEAGYQKIREELAERFKIPLDHPEFDQELNRALELNHNFGEAVGVIIGNDSDLRQRITDDENLRCLLVLVQDESQRLHPDKEDGYERSVDDHLRKLYTRVMKPSDNKP